MEHLLNELEALRIDVMLRCIDPREARIRLRMIKESLRFCKVEVHFNKAA